MDALGQCGLVLAVGPDLLALFRHDDGGARILAHGQNHARRNSGVLQQFPGYVAVVVRSLGVIENGAQFFQMLRSQQVGNISESLCRQKFQRRVGYFQNLLALEFGHAHMVSREKAEGSFDLAQGEHFVIGEV